MLRNEDYTDRELLHVIEAAALGGYASTDDIAEALGVSDNGHSKASRISPRLSWMARYGFIESVDATSLDGQADRGGYHGKLWTITPVGRALMGGRLTKPVERTLQMADPGTALLLMRRLTANRAPDSVAAALRREYQHNSAKRDQ